MARQTLRDQVTPVWAACKTFVENWWFWIIVALVLILLAVALIYAGYQLPWTGLGEYSGSEPHGERAKTLWDWLDLLLVPVLLALGAWFLNRTARQRERQTELDRSRDAALQTYLDRVTALLRSTWRESGESFVEANIIRAQTLTVLPQLDGERKGLLLRFLYESGLVGKWRGEERPQEPLVDLINADLRGARLGWADLRGAGLRVTCMDEADLHGADLRGADLPVADLAGANLHGARLGRVDLRGADLRGADLSGADLNRADLSEIKLRGAALRVTRLGEADLSEANLSGANLRRVDLSRDNLHGANLTGVNLTGANLAEAIVTYEELAQAMSLKGATLPDGTVHE